MSFRALSDELESRREQGLLRKRRILDGPQGAHATVDGRDVLTFCSNDYLGLASDPRLIQAATVAMAQYGLGAGASHLITGHTTAHHEAEQALARFVGLKCALLFSTGYMANLGVVTALAGRGDAVFADRLNHASLNDAAQLSRAEWLRYPHNDLAALAQRLGESKAKNKLVLTDTVFSMDGDLAPVPELLELCEVHDAWLLLDDAHGFGVLGEGRGALTHFNVASPRILYIGTLGKAVGVSGAFVAAAPEVIETLVQTSRPYIYTTAMPALLAATVTQSLRIIAAEPWRRERLQALVARLREGLRGCRWQLMDSATPIQPLLIGSNEKALRVSEALLERGILVPAIRPPTVPEGTARLRISLSARHTEADVDRLVQALMELAA
jgi:8-amino-7-oxononanoate synthase